MITTYFAVYLIFIIIVALIIGWMIVKFRLPSPKLLFLLLMLFILSPLLVGYFYVSYFDSLPEIQVPNVVGIPHEIALRNIEEAGLRARVSGSLNEIKYPEGTVVSQRPEAGKTVKAGRVINLMLSSGKSKVSVPNLIGRQFSQVDELLAAVGLQWGEVRAEKNLEVTEGTILAQEPMPGEEAPTDRPVDLIISTTLESQVVKAKDESDE